MLGPFATASRYIAIYQVSLLSHAACASMSTTTTTTTTTTRDRGEWWGPSSRFDGGRRRITGGLLVNGPQAQSRNAEWVRKMVAGVSIQMSVPFPDDYGSTATLYSLLPYGMEFRLRKYCES